MGLKTSEVFVTVVMMFGFPFPVQDSHVWQTKSKFWVSRLTKHPEAVLSEEETSYFKAFI